MVKSKQSFTEYSKEWDKLTSEIDKIIKDQQKKGNIEPEKLATYVQKKLNNDKIDRERIIKRYTRTLGGVFYSQL